MMTFHAAFAVKVFAALFAITNPIAAIPIFLGLTDGAPCDVQRRVAVTTVTAATIASIVAAVAGEPILDLFGIGIDDFKLAGGLLVFLLALPMVTNSVPRAPTEDEKEHRDTLDPADVAIYPLAVPILIGPGTIATLIVFGTQARKTAEELSLVVGLAVFLLALSLALLTAPSIGRHLSPTATSIARRLMGMILAAIAAEMIEQALRSLFPGLAH